MIKLVSIFVVLFAGVSLAARTLDSHLGVIDLNRLQKVFSDGVKSNDIQTIYYSAINLDKLTKDEKDGICKRLVEVYAESKLNDFEKNYYFASGSKILGCTSTIPPNTLSSIKSSLNKDIGTAQEIYYNTQSYKAINEPIGDDLKAKVAKNLEKILKKDDSLNSLGHGFLVASELGTSAGFVFDRIEDAIVQADEIDGKMLQFEGGLSITSLIINGALKLSDTLGKKLPLTDEQLVKFTTYFLSRRSVQTAKGASVLLESLRLISGLSENVPISIETLGNGQIYPDSQQLSIQICDILGRPLSVAIAAIQATITAKTGGAVLTSKSNLVPSANDKTVYSLDLKQFKPTRGVYNVEITAGKFTQKLAIKVIGRVKVGASEIGIGDSDSSSSVKKQFIVFPNKLDQVLSVDAQQKIVLKISLLDEESDKPITVHQSFVRLNNKETNEEIIFVAEQDTTKAYKFDMDVGARSADFNSKSGLYSIDLIVGDSSISNSFKWHVADIQIKFSGDLATRKDTEESNHFKKVRAPLPEIIHKFREPESRPPRFFSDLFSLLCAVPLLVLLLLWAKLRVNISNFPCSLFALGFHLGLGAILGLFAIFWLKLDMFETVRYLIPIALITFLCGNRLLRSIASKRGDKQ
jgi:oligosaccharyltransferase complex subunit delta (ribophorin II)